ncbi:hypothetical protein [uncultured Sphingomonas sp.]|uniref:hypothetical protein n=1 Tax=uncultured Sphingomonas sp. TaxID=158754 RepID=UPI0035CBFA81
MRAVETKVGIGSVWETAVEAVRGRAGLLVPIVAFALFLPAVIQAGLVLYTGGSAGGTPPTPGGPASLLRFALMLGLLVLTLWGALAVTAITGDPATTSAEAGRRASARVLPLLGVSVVIGLAMALLFVPLIGVLAALGVNLAVTSRTGSMPDIPGSAGLFIGLYGLFVTGLLLWVFARLLPLVPVVLDERLGLRSIARAFRLTRGLGLKLAGVVLLYAVVLFVASQAAQWVVFIPLRLILGAQNIGVAQFLGQVVAALVSAVFSVLAYAFTAQLYSRLTARERVEPFGDAHPAA